MRHLSRAARRTHAFALLVAAWGASACGGTGAPARAPAPDATTAAADAAPPPDSPPPADAAVAAPEPTGSPAAAFAEIGLDLRALPTGTSTDGIDLFDLGEADDLRRLAPAGAQLEIRIQPGSGGFTAIFRAASVEDAKAVCTRVVAAYLAQAPRLPVIMQPAAQLIRPCGPLDEAVPPSPSAP